VTVAGGAAREVRKVPRQPQQLQLEGERERIERRRRRAGLLLGRIQEVEKAAGRMERPRARVVLDEQAQHGLDSDRRRGETVRVERQVLV
jgi:hypothetical protein